MLQRLTAPKKVSRCCQFKNGDFPSRPEDFIVWEVANKYNLYIREIMRHDQRKVFTQARRDIAWRLYHELGYGAAAIGNMLHREETTGRTYVRAFKDDANVLDMRGMLNHANS